GAGGSTGSGADQSAFTAPRQAADQGAGARSAADQRQIALLMGAGGPAHGAGADRIGFAVPIQGVERDGDPSRSLEMAGRDGASNMSVHHGALRHHYFIFKHDGSMERSVELLANRATG